MAFTEEKVFTSVFGDKYAMVYKLTGDGSDVTWDAPVAEVDFAIYQRGTDTTADPLLTWSGNTITFATAPSNATYGHIFVVGY